MQSQQSAAPHRIIYPGAVYQFTPRVPFCLFSPKSKALPWERYTSGALNYSATPAYSSLVALIQHPRTQMTAQFKTQT
jgi:hypothetical protein